MALVQLTSDGQRRGSPTCPHPAAGSKAAFLLDGPSAALNTRRAREASAFNTVSAQLLRFVERSVGPGEGLDDGLARPVLCHPD